MAEHNNYDKDILKQLTRIANNLERITKHLTAKPINNSSGSKIDFGKPMKED